MKKPIILAIIIALIIVLWFVGGDFFRLDVIKSSLGGLRAMAVAHRFWFVLIFFLIYVVVTAASLPFATLLTLLGGAIFGFWQGLLIVSLASTTGATLAFLGARYFFQDMVQSRFGDRLDALNAGIEKDGAFYLFSLRLVPLFPFFLVNLLMGLTKIKLLTYVWVSWLGMLPGTMVYVYAGRNLGQLESLSGILSPELILSFTLLGLFPIIAKKLLEHLNARKVYRGFQKPKRFDRNLVVIGAGSAGLVSAYIAASSQAKVTLVEKNLMGGDCLNYGCVPSKALIKSARIAAQMRDASRFGLKSVEPEYDFKAVAQYVHDAIDHIAPNDSLERYRNMGVDAVEGVCEILDPFHVQITPHQGETYQLSTQSIIIATGATPFIPPIKGLADIAYLTSDNLWSEMRKWSSPPKRLLVLGGGNIGVELAQAFARLGSEVSILEMEDAILAREDEEVSAHAQNALEDDGVHVLTNHQAVKFSSGVCEARHGDETVQIAFDEVLVAVGRQARLEGFGAEKLGIETDRFVKANAHLATNFPNIFVAGDVVAPFQFTHTAAYEGTYAALNALFGSFKKFKMNYNIVPAVTFTDPEIARVGLNEKEAKARKIDYDVTYYPLSKLDRAETENATFGFVKILTQKGKDKIIGATIMGEHAGELIAEMTLAMKYKIGLRKILGTIHAYPTWSEANKNAAGQWSNAHLNEKLLRLPAWFLRRRLK